MDFENMYYGTRCFLEHKDLYNPETVRAELKADHGPLPEMSAKEKAVSGTWVMVQNYLPPAYLAMAPFALLPRLPAQAAWLCLVLLVMIFGGYLAWDLVPDAPVLAGCMTGFILLNSIVLLTNGNPAGVVLPFCVISAWCFLNDCFPLVGVALLAWSLVMKPHDAGLVWLFFLLAGGTGRKRALQTLAVTVILGVCSALWIAQSSPHWTEELHSAHIAAAVRGGAIDPGPTGMLNRGFTPFISLQNSVSVFKDDPHFYDPVSYAIGGFLILAWMVAVLRKRPSRKEALLALAAISILTMLPVYHHSFDAKLLLLTVPGCAILWKSKGPRRWIALGLTSAAILATSDIPIIGIVAATGKMDVSASTLGGKLTLLALQPAPLILLATGCFYLWVYIRYETSAENAERQTVAGEWLDTALANKA